MQKPTKKLDRNALQHYASMLLAQRAMTSGELRQKMRLKAIDAADIDPVIAQLTEYGALNDARYAEAYASARKENQRFGQARVFRDLNRKKIPSSLAKAAIELTYSGTDELTLIEDYLLRKFRGKNLSEFLAEQKNLASAFRRLRTAGYSASGSLQVLRRFSQAAEEIHEDDLKEDEQTD
ncbi:regulatory protein RecX [Bryobacter aggregatus]|uniref:regulatory protein RecX n=1 Tax=Bryobacter aggregatus TaxID=360054 RepID=UPI0004E12483|nr:RecX family transcriptional regulator [Bryobacter aggregatus]